MEAIKAHSIGFVMAYNLVVAYIFLLGVVGLLVYFLEKYTAIPEVRNVTAQSNKHGHRCFIEGLTDGEREVVGVLSRGLDSNNYFIFNNLILPSKINGSTQIDHIVASKFGIFVIESKDMGGWIFGRAHDEKWTQSFVNREKHHFQNPIRQNWGHTMTLSRIMPFIPVQIEGIVVFSDRSEFKTPLPEDVIHLSELVGYIKSFSKPILSEREVLLAIGKLSYMCQTTDITIEEHVANVRSSIASVKI